MGIFNIAQERGGVSSSVLCVLVQTHREANTSALCATPTLFSFPIPSLCCAPFRLLLMLNKSRNGYEIFRRKPHFAHEGHERIIRRCTSLCTLCLCARLSGFRRKVIYLKQEAMLFFLCALCGEKKELTAKYASDAKKKRRFLPVASIAVA